MKECMQLALRPAFRFNRVMFRCEGQNYWEAEDAAKRQLEQAQPLCEQYHVRIGVQNHTGDFVAPNAHGLYHLLKDCDTRYVGAIWDAGHEALEGVAPEIALDVLEGFLMMVNLKSGFWQRTNGPEAEFAEWEVFWTSARAGRADWRRVVRKLETIHYDGPICLTVEYSDSAALERLAEEDLSHARTLLGV